MFTATKRIAGANVVHTLTEVDEYGEEHVLATRRSAHSYNYAIIKRGRWGRQISWSRNPPRTPGHQGVRVQEAQKLDSTLAGC
jgi:hypothetical protein